MSPEHDDSPPSPGSALADEGRLHELARIALLDTPAERAFDRLTRLVVRELGVPVSLISLVAPDRQFFKSECGLPEPFATARQTPLSHSFCQHVVADRAALVVSDARADPRLGDNLAIPDIGVVAYAGFPLITPAGEVVGSFCAIDNRPRTWHPHELELLRDMAATTMDIVELRAEAVAAADAAGRFQRALVPGPTRLRRGQAWSAYRPGDDRLLLGGDFFACEERDDGTVNLVMGDVVGHGPEPAGFAAGLRSAWQALQLVGGPLPELAATLNTVALTSGTMEDRYATALLGRIAADRRSADLVLAGHPPPVLLGGTARQLELRAGPPLAVLEQCTWPVASVELPGDCALLVHTDGLTEARLQGRGRERLGIEPVLAEIDRLLALGTRPEGLLDGLIALAERASGERLADDIALLLVRPGG